MHFTTSSLTNVDFIILWCTLLLQTRLWKPSHCDTRRRYQTV